MKTEKAMREESATESLLQKKRPEKDVEANNGVGVGVGVGVGDGEGEGDGDGPVTLVLVATTFTALCGTFSYGTASGFTSPSQTGIMSELNLSLAEFSFFGSILTIGGVIGAVLSGRLTDLLGRRGALWVSNTFCFVGWLSIAFSQAAWSLDLGRLLLGIAAALVSYAVPVYLVEITPRSIRGAFTAVNVIVMCSGVGISYLVGSAISWQKLALINTVPCLVEFAGLFFIPDSPRWLSRNGRFKESEAALQHLRGSNTDITKEASEIKNYMENLQEIKEDGISELFRGRYARAVSVGIGLLLLQQLGGLSGYTFYMSSIFHKSGFPTGTGTVAATVVQSIVSIIGLLIVDKFGRRPLMMVSTVTMCMGSVLTGLSFLFQDYNLFKEFSPFLALTGVLVFLTSLSIGIGGIPWVMVSEMIPINIKASAGTLANLSSWSSNWLVSYSFNFLFEWSSSGVFFIYAIVSGLGILFVAKMVPETKGRSLEEIQASITG